MITQNDIYKLLAEGADAEKLAHEFTDALNNAISQYNQEQRKKDKEYQDFVTIINSITQYLNIYYPGALPADAAKCIDTKALFEDMTQQFGEIQKLLTPKKSKTSFDADATIAEFLRKNKLQ